MNETFNCRLDVAYPEVRTESRNTGYAALLTNDIAGKVSELSAITQYLYQHIVVKNEKIASALECISQVEMMHYEMISTLIYDFGGTPKLAVISGCSARYWSGQYPDYSCDPKSFLATNISNEQSAIAAYSARITQINDSYVKAVLERIIMDEEHHIEIFRQLLGEISA